MLLPPNSYINRGLGKTLQSICIIRTMLTQGPQGLPLANRVIIVTPSSLVKVFSSEFFVTVSELVKRNIKVVGHRKITSSSHRGRFKSSLSTID